MKYERHMCRNMRKVLTLFVCISLTGCAATHHNIGYIKGDSQYRKFSQLNDDQALDMVVLIYNTPTEVYEETIAKNITIDEFLAALKKRKSRSIEESGIFEIKYEKVVLKEWPDEMLVQVYESLDNRINDHDPEPVSELTHEENALRVMRLTARDSIVKEGKRRDNTKIFKEIAANAAMVALNVALMII